jgi:hypothetical protein
MQCRYFLLVAPEIAERRGQVQKKLVTLRTGDSLLEREASDLESLRDSALRIGRQVAAAPDRVLMDVGLSSGPRLTTRLVMLLLAGNRGQQPSAYEVNRG